MPPKEKIAKRKTIVYQTLVDPTVIKVAAEKLKNKLFVKFGFLKPKPEDYILSPLTSTMSPIL